MPGNIMKHVKVIERHDSEPVSHIAETIRASDS